MRSDKKSFFELFSVLHVGWTWHPPRLKPRDAGNRSMPVGHNGAALYIYDKTKDRALQ